MCAIFIALAVMKMVRLHRGVDRSEMHRLLVPLGAAPSLGQLSVGIALAIWPGQTGLADALAYLIIFSFAMALARAWSLVQGRHVKPPAR